MEKERESKSGLRLLENSCSLFHYPSLTSRGWTLQQTSGGCGLLLAKHSCDSTSKTRRSCRFSQIRKHKQTPWTLIQRNQYRCLTQNGKRHNFSAFRNLTQAGSLRVIDVVLSTSGAPRTKNAMLFCGVVRKRLKHSRFRRTVDTCFHGAQTEINYRSLTCRQFFRPARLLRRQMARMIWTSISDS